MKRWISVALASLMLARPGAAAIVHGGGGGGGGGGGMSHGPMGGGGMGHGPMGGVPVGGSISHGSMSPSPQGSWGGASHGPSVESTHVRSVGTTPMSRPAAAPATHPAGAPSSHAMNTTVVHNTAVVHSIAASQHTEIVPGHTWVHNSFSHFCSFDHTHWYGFWFGASFVWFPYYYNYWWWYDPYYSRWDYWYNGYWWWYGPGGATYIYVDNAYVPYDQYVQTYDASPPPQDMTTEGGSTALPAPPSTPPKTPPASVAKYAPTSASGAWKTPDGRRLVQISGAAGGAFLFDQTKSPPSLIKHLGDNAVNVRFAGGKSGPVKILVDYKDGTFHLYDENGHRAD